MSDGNWWRSEKELHPQQLQVLNLPDDQDFLLIGPPGSGKTNLLLLRAVYLIRAQRPNIALLMFTSSLRSFVLRGARDYRIAEDKIMTIERWSRRLLREHGVRSDDITGTFEERRIETAKRVWEVLRKKPGLKGHLECILVDEVQDCLAQELHNFFYAAKNVCLAGDERQRIYQNDNALDIIEKKGISKISLTHHYRSGHAICRVADAIGKTSGEPPISPTCNYREDLDPSKAEFFPCASPEKQFELIAAQLRQQVKTYNGELIGVACPLKEDAARCRDALQLSPVGDHLVDREGLDEGDPDRVIFVGTLHEVKGLEFRAIHLATMENVYKLREAQKRVAFTAVTRARTRLSVWWTGSIPGYLEQAAESVSPVKAAPRISDLFPEPDKS